MADSLEMSILRRLAPIPTASFFERPVHELLSTVYAENFRSTKAVSCRIDQWGNVIWHYAGDPNRLNPKSIANVVHTDHPAFHVHNKFVDGTVWIKMMGGLNPDLVVGTELDLHTTKNSFVNKGKVIGAVDAAEGNPSQRYVLKAETGEPAQFATINFGLEGRLIVDSGEDLLRSPVMDDFSAIAMSIAALREIVNRKLPIDIYTVFHRAEEVGLLGAHGVARSGSIPLNALVYSVENSSYKGKKNPESPIEQLAEIGGGIIIRTGDRSVPQYNETALELLRQARSSMENHKTQERLMTGGTCEAGIYGAHGFRVAGIAVPLKYYHNNGALEGKFSFVPEEIHEGDFHAGTALMVAAAETLARDPKLYGEFKPTEPDANLAGLKDRIGKRFDAYAREGLLGLNGLVLAGRLS